jgi:hypothetical protein
MPMQSSINVLMPCAIGHYLDPEVLTGLAMQTVRPRLYVATNRVDGDTDKLTAEADNRNALMPHIGNDPYVMLLDSDVALQAQDDIEACIDLLDKRPDLDAVAIDSKDISVQHHEDQGHVVIACVVARSSAMRGYFFTSGGPKSLKKCCCCIDFNTRNNVAYIRGRKVKEIKRKGLQ